MTHFSWALDGSIVGVYLLATMIAGIMVRKYVGKVEHFLIAGREMNLYLGIASLAATEFGVVTCMYTAQAGYKYGFAGATPGLVMAVAMFVVGWTGFCVKPLRDSGVMTIPELFEKKFGPGVRWLAGVVIVLGGLLNMGVFLRIGGDFLVLACGLDARYLEITMTVLLVAVAVYTILGGMLSVLVTDFLQFVVMSIGLIVVTALILWKVGWSTLANTVQTHYGDGGFNPFVHAGMGWEYVAFNCLLNLAAVLTWQTTIARLLAAKDTATGLKIYTRTSFFFVCRFLIPGVWGVAALTVLGWAPLTALDASTELDQLSPVVRQKVEASQAPNALAIVATDEAYAKLSPDKQKYTLTKAEADSIPEGIRTKLDNVSLHAMPRFLSTFVPIGLMGLLIAAMLAADMSTDSSYMLTWGSVIYNDIMAPLHKRRWSEKKGLLWNRFIVAGIGIFLLVYGLWYPLKGDLWTYLGLTGTIYLASISVLLIACCYWKRANNWGAYGAIIAGAAFPVAYLIMEKMDGTKPLTDQIGPYYSGIAAYVVTGLAMVVGSLLKPQSSVSDNGAQP
ncbi:MAG: sodium:solute symporter family protein [Planctomycetota bacterium]|nr:sodium:solute symporter family protein [Planctomycetota bacterium]